MRGKYTGVKDWNGKPIHVGDTIRDNVPSTGKVMEGDGIYFVTSDHDGRDINIMDPEYADELTHALVMYNEMVVIE